MKIFVVMVLFILLHLCISIPNNYPYQTLSKYKSIKNISTCVRKSTELMFKFSTIGINDFEKKLFLYSGKTPNDLGDYNKCLNEESTTFFLAKINFKTINFYFGICYFQECDVEAINSLLPKIFNFLELLNIKVKQYESNSVEITDTVEEELKNNEDFQFTFVIAMLFIFVISALYLMNYLLISFGLVQELEEKINKNMKNKELKYQDIVSVSSIELTEIDEKERVETSSDKLKFEDNKIRSRKDDESIIYRLIKEFNFYNQYKKLFTSNKHENNISDGIKFFCCFWVVNGHVFFIALNYGMNNVLDIIPFVKSVYGSIVFSALFAVDIFFFLSAFRLNVIIIEELKDRSFSICKMLKKFTSMIFLSYIRLLPIYCFVIFGIVNMLPFFSFGIFSYSIKNLITECSSLWWENLLYINNFYDKECATQSWYLANHMQFFMIFILLSVFLHNFNKIRNGVLFFIMVVSCLISVNLSYTKGYSFNDIAHERFNTNEFSSFYIKPYIRIPPFIMGIWFSNLNYYKENRINTFIKKRQLICLLIVIISITFPVASSYITNNFDINPLTQALMKTFNKDLFVFGIGLFMLQTYNGQFTKIKDFLSLPIFNVFSKLTFGIYMVHIYVIIIGFIAFNGFTDLNYYDYGFFSIGVFIISTFISIIMSLLLESPVISILKELRK